MCLISRTHASQYPANFPYSTNAHNFHSACLLALLFYGRSFSSALIAPLCAIRYVFHSIPSTDASTHHRERCKMLIRDIYLSAAAAAALDAHHGCHTVNVLPQYPILHGHRPVVLHYMHPPNPSIACSK